MGSIAIADDIIFRSKLPDIPIDNNRPLHDYLFEHLPAFHDRPCVVDAATGSVLTYADVAATSRRFAAGLRRVGIQKGQVYMILLRNSPEFIISFLAASFSGAVATTANPFYTPAEIKRQAIASKARAIITESAYVEKVRDLADEHGIVLVCVDGQPSGCHQFEQLLKHEKIVLNQDEEERFNADDVVALPYSSGTTGLPKGVMLTHRSLITSVAQQVDGENPNLDLGMDDVVLCLLPLFHIYCLNTVLLCGVRVGAAVVVMRRFEMVLMMEVVQRYGVSVLPVVPPVVVEVVKSPMVECFDLSSIRMVLSGAAPMRKEVEDKLAVKLPNAVLGQVSGRI